VKAEMTEAGIFVDKSSVATLAMDDMELTMAGQMLSTSSTEATLYSASASLKTHRIRPPVASVARTVCNSKVRR
jgi:hypothetical protein